MISYLGQKAHKMTKSLGLFAYSFVTLKFHNVAQCPCVQMSWCHSVSAFTIDYGHHNLWCRRWIFAIDTTICGVGVEIFQVPPMYQRGLKLWGIGKQKVIWKTLGLRSPMGFNIPKFKLGHFFRPFPSPIATLSQNATAFILWSCPLPC